MKKLLYRLTGNMPCRLIDIEGEPYLERYYVGCFLGITVYLHRFVSADGDRSLHDHPWKLAVSAVLCGSYHERRLVHLDTKQRTGMLTKLIHVKWLNIIRGSDFHQIINAKPETWTLFIHTKKSKGWGFLTCNRAVVGRGTAKVMYDMPFDINASNEWWKTAHKGKHATREPMDGVK